MLFKWFDIASKLYTERKTCPIINCSTGFSSNQLKYLKKKRNDVIREYTIRKNDHSKNETTPINIIILQIGVNVTHFLLFVSLAQNNGHLKTYLAT